MATKLYKFSDLSLKDQMRLEVDFYGESVEVEAEELEEMIKRYAESWKYGLHEGFFQMVVMAIIKLYNEPKET